MAEQPDYEELKKKIHGLENNWQEMQSTLAIAQEMADLGYWSWNIGTGEIFWSDHFYRLLGFQPRQIKPSVQKYRDLIHPDDLHLEKQSSEEALSRPGATYEVIHRIIRPEGSMRVLRSRGKVVRWSKTGEAEFMVGTSQDITELKRQEKELLQNEAQFRQLAEAIREVFWIGSPDWKKLYYVSPAYEEVWGRSCKSIYDAPLSWLDHVHEEDRALVQEAIARKSGGDLLDPHFPEYRILRPDGTIRWIAARAFPVREDDVVVRIAGIAEDITDRRIADKQLEASEKKYRNLVENTEDLITRVDREGNFTFVNHMAEKFFGYPSEQCIGKGAFQFVHPDDRERTRNWLGRVVAGKMSKASIENKLVNKKTGEIFTLLWASSLEHDEAGDVTGIGGIGRDVTKIRATEQDYQNLFEKMHDGFAHHEIICDVDGTPFDYRFLTVNPSFEKLTGLKAENIIGKTVLEVLPSTEKHWIDTYGKVALTGSPVTFTNYSGELEKYFEVTAYRPAKNQFACIFQDITPRVKAEEERRNYEAQLRHAQKMEAIGTLSGGIAHDFNNILAAILGYAEMAKEDLPEWNPARTQIEQVQKAADRAKELVKHILVFSRKTEQDRHPLQMQHLIKETMAFLRATIPTTIEIRTQCDPDCGKILADPTQIHQVLMNLCTNALHAMEEKGGVLSVELQKVDVKGDDVGMENANRKSGPYVQISVSDTGVGIEKENLDRIFDPYFTTKEIGKGSGMGLAVVHGIVQSHGGWISVESRPGQGTTFRVFFPQTADKSEEKTAASNHLPLGSERILIVDDDAAIAELTKGFLKKLGYRTTSKTDSLEAIETFKSDPQSFDLVITDQTMPELTGEQLADELMRIRPGMPIVLCTGYSSRIDADKAAAMGISAFLMKPVDLRTLADTVRQLLDQTCE